MNGNNEAQSHQHQWLYFNIHDLVRIRVARGHPSEQSIMLSWGEFQVEHIDSWNLTIVFDELPDYERTLAAGYEFAEGKACLRKYEICVLAEEGKLTLCGRRDPQPFVAPPNQWIMLQKNHTYVHAAAIAVNGRGILLPAWGGTGKTSAVIRLLQLDGAAFMSDDYSVLSKDGTLYGIPKPFFIYPYHQKLFPHLFKKKPKILVPQALSGAMESVREVLRPLFMKYPKLEKFGRRFTPEHMQTPARKALPDAEFADRAPLSAVLFLERYTGRDVSLGQLDADTARRRLITNYHFETSRYAKELMIVCGAAGIFSLDEFFGRMRDILDRALKNRPIFCLRMPPMDPRKTGDVVAEAVETILKQAN